MQSLLEKDNKKKFLKSLLSWYKKYGRHDMPWRKTKDAYSIFVSEYMLQQTTVSTVRPYYDRFLNKFPTAKALASGDLNDVLALWSGLGYYARARNLWAAMKTVQSDGGKIPSQFEELKKLPGVGSYTAGAIATLAFNKPAAVLDGNIIRVLMRLLAIEDDPKFKPVQDMMNRFALELNILSLKGKNRSGINGKGGPRDLTLALMDLGATLCAPKSPQCSICPAKNYCLANYHGRQEYIPPKSEKLDRQTLRRHHAVVPSQGKFLVGQRPRQGLFGGLWEFVGVDAVSGTEPVLYLEETIRREIGLPVRVAQSLLAFDHQLSHRNLLVRSFLCKKLKKTDLVRLKRKGLDYERFKWIAPVNFSKFGVSAVTRKILNQVLSEND